MCSGRAARWLGPRHRRENGRQRVTGRQVVEVDDRLGTGTRSPPRRGGQQAILGGPLVLLRGVGPGSGVTRDEGALHRAEPAVAEPAPSRAGRHSPSDPPVDRPTAVSTLSPPGPRGAVVAHALPSPAEPRARSHAAPRGPAFSMSACCLPSVLRSPRGRPSGPEASPGSLSPRVACRSRPSPVGALLAPATAATHHRSPTPTRPQSPPRATWPPMLAMPTASLSRTRARRVRRAAPRARERDPSLVDTRHRQGNLNDWSSHDEGHIYEMHLFKSLSVRLCRSPAGDVCWPADTGRPSRVSRSRAATRGPQLPGWIPHLALPEMTRVSSPGAKYITESHGPGRRLRPNSLKYHAEVNGRHVAPTSC